MPRHAARQPWRAPKLTPPPAPPDPPLLAHSLNVSSAAPRRRLHGLLGAGQARADGRIPQGCRLPLGGARRRQRDETVPCKPAVAGASVAPPASCFGCAGAARTGPPAAATATPAGAQGGPQVWRVSCGRDQPLGPRAACHVAQRQGQLDAQVGSGGGVGRLLPLWRTAQGCAGKAAAQRSWRPGAQAGACGSCFGPDWRPRPSRLPGSPVTCPLPPPPPHLPLAQLRR